jgi:hypothetical protein
MRRCVVTGGLFPSPIAALVSGPVALGLMALAAASPKATAANGDLFVQDFFTGSGIHRFNGNTGAYVNTMVPPSGGNFSYLGSTFGPNGNLYVLGNESNGVNDNGAVFEYNGASGAYIGTVVSDPNLNNQATGLAIEGNSIYVGNFNGNNGILKYDLNTGASQGVFVQPGSGGLGRPQYLTFGPDGNLYADSTDPSSPHGVLEYNGQTGAFIKALATDLAHPQQIQFYAGNLYVDDPGYSNTIKEYDPETGALIKTIVASGQGGIDSPTGFAIGQDGDLYTSARNNGGIYSYNAATGASNGQFTDGAGVFNGDSDDLQFAPVPEPAALPLLALTAALMMPRRRRR